MKAKFATLLSITRERGYLPCHCTDFPRTKLWHLCSQRCCLVCSLLADNFSGLLLPLLTLIRCLINFHISFEVSLTGACGGGKLEKKIYRHLVSECTDSNFVFDIFGSTASRSHLGPQAIAYHTLMARPALGNSCYPVMRASFS